MNNGEFQAHSERIDRLVQRVTNTMEGDARSTALELLQSVMDLHGAVVARIVEILGESGEHGRSLLTKLGGDPLVCGLLVLYGLHPVEFDKRVANAIEKLQPRLKKQAATVELLGVSENTVRVKIHSSGHGCGNSPDAIKETVEQAILEAAPETAEIIVEGVPSKVEGFVPLGTLQPVKKEDSYEESAA